MARVRAAFTLVEIVTSIVVVATLLAFLVPAASRSRNTGNLYNSIQNVSRIMGATHAFYLDHASAPMLPTGISGGQINGWDSWSLGGKNCDVFWNGYTGGIFDEPAYVRPLNPYIYSARIAVPVGYLSNATTYAHGHPTAADRLALQIAVFRSPGDVTTRQRAWPNPTAGVSAYDDIGTSYELNMKWWGAPGMPTGSFSQQYFGGVQRVGQALGGATPNFIFVNDQTADVVSYGYQTVGEFGKLNASVVGWADGRAGYLRIVPNAYSGPGYTFIP